MSIKLIDKVQDIFEKPSCSSIKSVHYRPKFLLKVTIGNSLSYIYSTFGIFITSEWCNHGYKFQ
jgi:hypothetical protein